MSLPPTDAFAARHLGPRDAEMTEMLATLGASSLDDLVSRAVPSSIRTQRALDLPARSEGEALAALRAMATKNQVFRSYLGMGYHDTITPPVILRNILENPGWYTAYTPYQAEISQGRLEALLTFQTVVAELTGLPVANASLLDEATAAAEAMAMSHRLTRGKVHRFFAAQDCHPQTLAVLQTRAEPLGIEVVVGDPATFDFSTPVFGALLQYPTTDGRIEDYAAFCDAAHAAGALVTVATDLLALCLLRPPADFGADIAIGSSQRFGVPLGYGGPHAAFLAATEKCLRQIPGRIIGVSRDMAGGRALRMSLQTREQHIRREKATSNICTAQVLLAVVAGMYAVYHGPDGLRRIAGRVRGMTGLLAAGLLRGGYSVADAEYFDTLRVDLPDAARRDAVIAAARERGINLRAFGDASVCVAFDESVGLSDVDDVLSAFGVKPGAAALAQADVVPTLSAGVARTGELLPHPVFHKYRSETEMLRYLHRLESKDLSLTTAMIPLGSCTMKLNATSEMIPVTWEGFGRIHPYVPLDQAAGYQELFGELECWLTDITGFSAASFQPNAGSQGEYAGLLTIRAWHRSRGDHHRDVCLIPKSAHGTNPASAVMAGLDVVVVACDDHGNVDLDDLRARAAEHAGRLAALMVTYPSTHGVFEESIAEICRIVHEYGGQVYLDGANMNAMVGLCRPGELGADVCHLNLHKTFCIPHGGGGPGMGPICVAAHLAPFLPGHPVVPMGGSEAMGAVSAAPWGSPSILPISWAYIAMMGGAGLTDATKVAILNANYVAARVRHAFPVLYSGRDGLVAHECILDLRHLKHEAGIEVDDVAKRLMDYGFHAPTMSFPVAGTLMVEPTESESKAELDRLCDALLAIKAEIDAIVAGESDRTDNALHGAPHTAAAVIGEWGRAYSREQAAFPTAATRNHKYWPTVGRVDNVWGDRNMRSTWDRDEQPT